MCYPELQHNNPFPYKPSDPAEPVAEVNVEGKKGLQTVAGMGRKDDDNELYHGLFPRRRLWSPAIEYPLWDDNWDGRQPTSTIIQQAGGGEEQRKAGVVSEDHRIRKEGVTRHIILIHHGQYDETYKVRNIRACKKPHFRLIFHQFRRIQDVSSRRSEGNRPD